MMTTKQPSQISTTSLDLAAMRRRFGDDDALVREVVGAFLQSVPKLREEFFLARERADRAGMVRAIHGLRGALLDITAVRAADLANALEHGHEFGSEHVAALWSSVDDAVREAEALSRSA